MFTNKILQKKQSIKGKNQGLVEPNVACVRIFFQEYFQRFLLGVLLEKEGVPWGGVCVPFFFFGAHATNTVFFFLLFPEWFDFGKKSLFGCRYIYKI